MLKPKRLIYKKRNTSLPDEEISGESGSIIITDFSKELEEVSPNNNPASTPSSSTPSSSTPNASALSTSAPIELKKNDILNSSEDPQFQESQESQKGQQVQKVQQEINSALNQIQSNSDDIPTIPPPPALNMKRQKSLENLPQEELDKRKKLIAKLIEKTNQDPRFKALIQHSLSFFASPASPIFQKLNEDQFLHLTQIELQFLLNTPPELFNISLLIDIFQQKASYFEDIINGNPTPIIFYKNKSKVLGRGGFGEVSACLYAKAPKNEEETETAQLKEGAIKIVTNLDDREATKFGTQSELDTLSEIRESGDYEGLLTPIHMGSETSYDYKNNPASQEHYFITEIIHPLKGALNTHLSPEIINKQKAEKTIGYIKEACKGLKKIHKQGRVHWDLKHQNVFVGDTNKEGTSGQGKLGDLACPKVSEDFLHSLIIHHKTFTEEQAMNSPHIQKTKLGPNKGLYQLTLPFIANPLESKTSNFIQIPITIPYINRAYRHLQLFKNWAETGNPENIPPEILALVDMGQMAEFLDRICEMYKNPESSKVFPSEEIQDKTIDELTKLIERLDNIPENIVKKIKNINLMHEKLNNPLLLEDQKQSIKNRLEKFQKELQELLPKHLMTAEKLKTELENIENMIKSNR